MKRHPKSDNQLPKGKSDAERQQEFVLAYQELCKKHGLQFVPVLQWRQSADTGTFSTLVLMQVGQYQPPQE